MDRRSGHRHGVDRTRQALAEWCGRKLQRQVPRRMSQVSNGSAPEPRPRSSSKIGAGTSTTCGRIRASAITRRPNSPAQGADFSVREATGRDAAVYGAFAPRPVAPPPAKGTCSKGRRLKLAVVRRNRAGREDIGAGPHQCGPPNPSFGRPIQNGSSLRTNEGRS